MSSDRVGDWTIERELARDAHWIRYRTRRGNTVAEVTVSLAAADDEITQRAFQREVAQLRQLVHPHLVRFLEAGVADGRAFYALEHVAGPTVEAFVAERGPLAWEPLFGLVRQLASALKFAHDRGICHGDLAGDNVVFVSSPGDGPLPVAKITGFGPAAAVPPPPPSRITACTAPERREGKPAGPRGDMYSLGCIFVMLCSGRVPPVDDPLSALPRVPNEFRVLLERMLDAEPTRRPADGNTLCRQLDKVRESLNEPAPSEAETKEATAALVSQFVREELESQSQGGPVQRFFNQPWVVLPLFLLCAGTLVWTFWPLGQDELFRRGAELMRSDDPADWSRAFSDYLDPLEAKFPDHPHKTQVVEFRNRLAQNDAERAAARAARWAGPMTEPQWIYQQALRARQQGYESQARALWRGLIDVFEESPTEGPWVRLARQRLEEEKPDDLTASRKLGPVREAEARVRRLRGEGKEAQAERIEKALQLLYGDELKLLQK